MPGSGENTAGALRPDLPKGTDFASPGQRELDAIDERTNNRPCHSLGWMIPNEAWSAQIQLLTIAIGT